MRVSAIIVNWNGAQKLKLYLPAILKVKDVDEFIVSDDASTDESVELIREKFPEVKLVRREKNGGFSSNVNSGVKAADGDLAFLLNPDAVPEKDCVSRALEYFKDPKLFSISCNTGGNWSWAKWEKGFFWHYVSKGEIETHQTLWARGGSGMFRKSIFNELGGMDELLNPYYEEDTDLGYRATKRGYENLWVKECKVNLPKERGVIAQNVEREVFSKVAQRNQLLFIWKNITDSDLICQHMREMLKMLILTPKYWPVFLEAFSKLMQIRKKRKIELSWAKLTDKEILGKFQQ